MEGRGRKARVTPLRSQLSVTRMDRKPENSKGMRMFTDNTFEVNIQGVS